MTGVWVSSVDAGGAADTVGLEPGGAEPAGVLGNVRGSGPGADGRRRRGYERGGHARDGFTGLRRRLLTRRDGNNVVLILQLVSGYDKQEALPEILATFQANF